MEEASGEESGSSILTSFFHSCWGARTQEKIVMWCTPKKKKETPLIWLLKRENLQNWFRVVVMRSVVQQEELQVVVTAQTKLKPSRMSVYLRICLNTDRHIRFILLHTHCCFGKTFIKNRTPLRARGESNPDLKSCFSFTKLNWEMSASSLLSRLWTSQCYY